MATPFKGISVADGGADIPAGRYRGAVRDIEQMAAKTTGDPFLVWTCVVEVDGEQVEVDGSSSLNTGPRSKPRRWMKAVLDREIARGEYIAREDLLGRPCVIDVEISDNGWAYVADIKPVPPASPTRSASANRFTEEFAAKSAAAQASVFAEEPASPPVPIGDLPF